MFHIGWDSCWTDWLVWEDGGIGRWSFARYAKHKINGENEIDVIYTSTWRAKLPFMEVFFGLNLALMENN